MKQQQLKELSDDELRELDFAERMSGNPYAFEHLCGACDNFGTDECPFKNKANYNSEYAIEFNCKNFFD